MNKNYISIFTFIAGVVIGAASAFFVTKKYYEKRSDEEIESVKKAFKERQSGDLMQTVQPKVISEKFIKDPVVVEEAVQASREIENELHKHIKTNYSTIIKDNKYGSVSESENPTINLGSDGRVILKDAFKHNDGRTVPNLTKPYILSEDEWDPAMDFVGYKHEFLDYHPDGVITEGDCSVVPDPEEIIGTDYIDYFKENKNADTVYVRNDALKTTYEICRVNETYAELLEDRPYLKNTLESGDD